MGTEKILKKLSKILDKGEKKRRKERDKLKELLTELRRKEKRLKEKIGRSADSDKARRLEKELQVVHAQRKKGVAALRKINNESD